MTVVALTDADDRAKYGGKAAQLGVAVRAGIKVPRGLAVSVSALAMLSEGPGGTDPKIQSLLDEAESLIVRSSAIDEDGTRTSFAGHHTTIANVRSTDGLADALHEVRRSATTRAAQKYRDRMGLGHATDMAAVIQRLVHADVSGVLFTRNPVDGTDERLVEASWGLGESVVSGLVIPDRVRFARGGEILERHPGTKDRAIHPHPTACGTFTVEIDDDRTTRPALSDAQIRQLDELATRCDAVYDGDHDIEFAFEHDELYLLQRRPITTGNTP